MSRPGRPWVGLRQPRSRRVRVAVSLLALVATLGCEGPEPAPEPPNEAPVLVVRWPQLWARGEPVPFDLGESFDVDGELSSIRMVFGDGSPEQERASGRFDHAYDTAGSYRFRALVEDDDGSTVDVQGDVVITDELDDPACDCDRPCFDDGACVDGACFEARSSEPVEPPLTFAGALSCPSDDAP